MSQLLLTEDILHQMDEVAKYSKLVYDRGLVTAAGGNVSVRCGEYVLLTASGVSLRDITRASILICDMEGNILYNPNGLKPTKEKPFHLNVYRERPCVDSIIHVHPPYTVAYTYSGKNIPMVTGSAEMKLKAVPIVPYEWPGSDSLADAVTSVVRDAGEDCHCVVLQRHGIIAYETGLSACFDIAELAEDTARIALLAGV